MVSTLDSGSNGPGSSPGRGHCVQFSRLNNKISLSKVINNIVSRGDSSTRGVNRGM